jgi:hypothetical protein
MEFHGSYNVLNRTDALGYANTNFLHPGNILKRHTIPALFC